MYQKRKTIREGGKKLQTHEYMGVELALGTDPRCCETYLKCCATWSFSGCIRQLCGGRDGDARCFRPQGGASHPRLEGEDAAPTPGNHGRMKRGRKRANANDSTIHADAAMHGVHLYISLTRTTVQYVRTSIVFSAFCVPWSEASPSGSGERVRLWRLHITATHVVPFERLG